MSVAAKSFPKLLSFFYVEQATHVTFMCPMRFNKFPLDEHTCKFMVGSSNYDDTRMTFSNEKLVSTIERKNNICNHSQESQPLQFHGINNSKPCDCPRNLALFYWTPTVHH